MIIITYIIATADSNIEKSLFDLLQRRELLDKMTRQGNIEQINKTVCNRNENVIFLIIALVSRHSAHNHEFSTFVSTK